MLPHRKEAIHMSIMRVFTSKHQDNPSRLHQQRLHRLLLVIEAVDQQTVNEKACQPPTLKKL
jgi:hypothetical protein